MNLYIYISRWLSSTNAKDIGVLYMIIGILSAIVGTSLSLIIRSELAVPGMHIIESEKFGQIYNVIITAHAIFMVFFFVMPTAIGAFGNYIIPIMIGSVDMAFNFGRKDLSVQSLFSNYLAGLYEGEGYIWIPKNKKNPVYGIQKSNPVFGIKLNIIDLSLANKIISIIGKGHIVKRKGKTIELRITSIVSLKKVIELINGKLRTPKIDQLHKLIDWMNLHHSLKIEKRTLDNSTIDSNSWLAGYIEAEGGFYIRHSLKQISCKFNLEQKMIDPKSLNNIEPILKEIASYLEINLNLKKRKKGNYYILKVENKKSVSNLIKYLTKYPLFSTKYLDYLNWKEALKLILNKKHTTKEGSIYILNLKNNMNDKRISIDWTHLKNLF